MKTFLGIAIFIITSTLSYSQDGSTFAFSPEWDVYANNYLNGPAPGRGNTGVASCSEGISGVLLNPASFNVNKKFEFSYQFNYKTNSYYSKYPYFLYKNQFPSMAAAAGFKFNKNIDIGVYYNNPRAAKNGYTDILTIQTLGVPICFSIEGFGAGISLEYTYYYASESDPYKNNSYYADAEDFNVRFGIAYETPDKIFSVGISAIPGTTLKPHSNLPGPVGLEYFGWPTYPFQIITGFSMQIPKTPLRLSLEYKAAQNTLLINTVDDLKLGAEYRLNKKIILRCGGFTNQNTGNFKGQMYLTAGCGIKLSNFNIDAAILDSHISKGPEGTIFQTSLAYGF